MGLQALIAAGTMFCVAAYEGRINIKRYETHHPTDGCCPPHAIPFIRMQEYAGLQWLFDDGRGGAPFTDYHAGLDGALINIYQSRITKRGREIREQRYGFPGSDAWQVEKETAEARYAQSLSRGTLTRFTASEAAHAAATNTGDMSAIIGEGADGR